MATSRPQRTLAPVLALDAMPTLADLYARGKLSAPAASTAAAAQVAHRPDARLNARVSLVRHDITRIAADAVVNAANESLLGGGGVDGAIHRAAGARLLEACMALRGCATGDAKMTPGFGLPAKTVIHTVGPIYYRMADKVRAAELLRGCYRRALEVGEQAGVKSIVFCPIATGIYGYPNEKAAEVAIGEVRRYFEEGRGRNFERVVFTNILAADYEPYVDVIP
jgi:O-acetyl-ADP-ribose deacetylase (regulator of RNase III)